MSATATRSAQSYAAQRWWVVVWLLLLAISAAAVWYVVAVFVPHERSAAIEVWRGRLSAMADDRKTAITSWLSHRLGDARVVAEDPTAVYLLSEHRAEQHLLAQQERRQRQVQRLLDSMQGAQGYRAAYALDAGGNVVVDGTGSPPLDPACRASVARVLSLGRPEVELHAHADGLPMLAITAPVRVADRTVGAVLLFDDPARWLYPLLLSEPIPTRTGESLLAHQVGDQVEFLSPLRHRFAPPLSFRLPFALPLLAVAAIRGEEGFRSYVDYRGVRVLGVARRIPGTGWGLVVKVDEDEAFSAFRRSVMEVALAWACVLLALAGLGFGAWRTQAASYRARVSESEARFALLRDHANDAILFASRDGVILDVNRKAEESYVRRREELLGLPFDELRAPEERAALRDRVDALARDDELVFEAIHRRFDGTRFPVEVSIRVADIGGQDVLVSIVRDITERKRTEETLRESEERYRDLVENSSDLICTHDLDGTLLSANAAAMRTTGLQVENLGRFNIRDLVSPEYRAAVDAYLEVIRREGSAVGVMKVITRSGETRYWEYRNSLRTEGVPTPVVRGIARDITERKRAEQALKTSEEKYRRILENMEESYFEVDIAGNLTFVNESLCRLLGYPRDELLGMNNRQFTDKENAKKLFQAFNKTYRTGESAREFDWEVIRKTDGTKRHIETSISLRRDISDQPIGFGGLIRDVTERKQAEDALRESKEWFRQLAETMPDAVLVGQDGKNVYANSAAARLLRAAGPEEVVGLDVLAIVDSTSHERALQRIQGALAGETQPPFEERFVRLDGSLVPVEISVSLLTWQGRPALQVVVRDITERKRAEEALRQSEARFKAAFASSPNGMALVAPDGRWLEVNPALCQIVGYSEAELLAKTFQDITHPDDLDSDLIYVRQMLTGEIPTYQMEKRYLHKQGQVVWILLSVSLVRDSTGQPLYFVSQIQDITERKLAAQALRESEERYRLIAENTVDVIWTLDLATRRLTYVSPSVERLRGFTPEEVMGQPFSASLTPDSLRRVDAYLAAALAAFAAGDQSARTGTVEADMPTKHGGIAQTEIVATTLLDASGRATGVLGVTRDITERRQAEKALRESEERFRTLYENSPIGLYRTTPDGRVLMANPIFVDMLGYASFDELASRNLKKDADFQPSYPRAQFLEALERDGEVRGVEAVWKQADGNMVFMRESARAIRDSQGNTLYYDGSVENITERKKAEAEREKLEENLRQSQKMEAVGQLAGGVAHDFNNLLQAILSLTHVLLTHCTDPERVTADAVELEQHVKHGAALTRQLLVFSRRDTARPETLDLNEMIREAGKLLRRLLKGNIAVELRLTERKLPVQADRGQLEQVLFNLAVNAADAMPEGGQLVITTGSNRSTVWLQVADTGVGIPARIRERIFEPFFTTKEEGKGTGLGLAVVHGIVAQHGGSIAVESREGQGTTFTVTLPRGASGEFAALKVKELPDEAPAGHGDRVLVVEDEAAARDSLAEILTLLGYEVVAVGSGEEAGLLPAEPVFKVLLTDLMLPGIAGADLARGLLERWPKLQVILMSGYTKDEALRQGISAGPARFLQKPFGMTALARALRSALDDAPAASAGGDQP